MSDWISDLLVELKADLIAAGTLAGSRVELERNDPIAIHPSEAGDLLPKLCVYMPEDTSSADGNGTIWATRATITIDCWTRGVEQTSPAATAQEHAGQERNQLASQVIAATVGKPQWRAKFEKVTSLTRKRDVATTGTALVVGAEQIGISVELHTDPGHVETEDLFEGVDIDAGVADADGATDYVITAEPSQEDDA